MHNPYATSPAGEGGPQPSAYASGESSRTTDYNEAIGPNSDYYRPRFEKFDERGPRLSWNWPAFFATSSWYVYRKLYLIGILNFFYPFVLLFGLGLMIATRVLSPTEGGAAIILLSPVPWLLLTLLANRIYWRRISGVIEDASGYGDPARRSREMVRNGGVARGPMAVMVVVTVIYFVGWIGFISAISIPAYQDYTIRSQVYEGLNQASAVKFRVADYRETNHAWPNDADLGMEPTDGKYVDTITVASGSVIITYGNAANSRIAGKQLRLQPGIDGSGEVVWACGNTPLADGVEPGEGPRGSEVPDIYLPVTCRTPGPGAR